MNEQRAAAAAAPSPTPATEQEAWAQACRGLPDGDARALYLFERIERAAVEAVPAEKLAELKPLQPSRREADEVDTNYVMTYHPEIVEGARGWYKNVTGGDLTAEQRSVLMRTISERARYAKPDAEELRAVRLLSLKRGVVPPRVGSSLQARAACAELAGTDGRATWGRVAIEVQKRRDEIDRHAAHTAARFAAALPRTPRTADHFTPPTVRHIVELSPQREREITAKYRERIDFAETLCREAGDAPTTNSRRALVAILAAQDAAPPTPQTLAAYNHLHEAKEVYAAPPTNEAHALSVVNDVKGTREQFWLDTGRAAVRAGERMRRIEELSAAAIEVYRRDKGRALAEDVRLTLRENLFALAEQPPPDEQMRRIARSAEHKGVPAPTFDDAASSSHWLVRNSPDGDGRLLRFVEGVEAEVAERSRVFQIDPTDPQQRAGSLYTEWMVATVGHAEYHKLPQRNIDEWGRRIEQEAGALDEYRRAARQHEKLYEAQPRAIMTGEQHDHLLEHKSSLGSAQRQALTDAIVAGVSPEGEPLGRASEPGHRVHAPARSPSRSDDCSP